MSLTVMIAIFGAIGVLLRYGIDRMLSGVMMTFPTSTFAINIVGSFLIGFIYSAGVEHGVISKDLTVALSAGLLGGFTTFSAYGLQTVLIAQGGSLSIAALYFVMSPVLAALGAFAGLTLARTIV